MEVIQTKFRNSLREENISLEKLILTKKENKDTHYCENFCPIYESITQYNNSHFHKIACPSRMCEVVTTSYVLNKREETKG